jgi:hypothetical protein
MFKIIIPEMIAKKNVKFYSLPKYAKISLWGVIWKNQGLKSPIKL